MMKRSVVGVVVVIVVIVEDASPQIVRLASISRSMQPETAA